jgi:putative transposase
MGNHYHLSVKIKEEVDIQNYLDSIPVSERSVIEKDYMDLPEKSELISDLVSSAFRRFFISYSQAFNKKYNRKGNLFNKPFKRSLFDPEIKFFYLQYYIHHNARKHGLVSNFEEYRYHSYFEILDGNSNIIDISEIILRFGSLENFELFHKEKHYEDKFEGLIIEE